ncbi:MAG: hypothetical protein ACREKR_08535 [Candidatus Methylomirabilales bacterium]
MRVSLGRPIGSDFRETITFDRELHSSESELVYDLLVEPGAPG